ncbi:MAG: cell division protein ZapA [Gammaproteobacteria bacterium]|nr:cell division protein ZapA [Gammaproteobacteria bacterium]
MSKEPEAIKVNILDKEYLVACPENEKDALVASAKFLNQKMLDIRGSGKVVGIDRIAVMTALNLAHEVIGAVGSDNTEFDSYGVRIRKLNTRIEKALDKYQLKGLN